MNTMSIARLAVTFFIIMDSIGNIPLYLSLLHRFPEKKRRKIIVREMLIALGVILLFAFLGNEFLELLHVKQSTVGIAGGVILFIIALQMIFPNKDEKLSLKAGEDPFIVPLAVPFVAGPAILGAVMIYADQLEDFTTMTSALLIAWGASLIVLLSSSLLARLVGKQVLIAGERLMGFVMTLIALNLLTDGLALFLRP